MGPTNGARSPHDLTADLDSVARAMTRLLTPDLVQAVHAAITQIILALCSAPSMLSAYASTARSRAAWRALTAPPRSENSALACWPETSRSLAVPELIVELTASLAQSHSACPVAHASTQAISSAVNDSQCASRYRRTNSAAASFGWRWFRPCSAANWQRFAGNWRI